MLTVSQISKLQSLARTVRGLSIDAVQKANSGHPGLPLGCADIGALLYASVLKHDPTAPEWIDRDRFVLSAGHGSMFLYSFLHLCGYGLSLDDIKQFRQLGSRTPGHPEYGLTTGVETTTGPLGAGFATAVGMAIAENHLAAVFNTPTHKVIDHYTYVLAGDGCMMEGVSSEAASMAGHMGLGKLIVLYDSNHITIEGKTDIAFTENVGERFKAYGWQVLRSNGYDHLGLASAINASKQEVDRPSLIIVDTVIGYGSPNKSGSHDVHGSPLGPDEVKATKQAIGLDPEQDFFVPDSDRAYIAECTKTWTKTHEDWEKLFGSWAAANPELKAKWDLHFGTTAASPLIAKQWGTKKIDVPAINWPEVAVGSKTASRASSGNSLQSAAAALPNLIGGSADLASSNNTELKGQGHYQKESPSGRNFHFGVREHAMGSVVNGMVLHGGLKTYGATFLVFSDYMRPSLRLAAIMKIPSIFIFTHDSIWVGEDGPTHQPVEHVSCLRAIPGMEVLRPADAEETAFCWQLTLEKRKGSHALPEIGHPHPASLVTRDANGKVGHAFGPTSLILTRQALTVAAKPAGWQESIRHAGAYIAFDAAPGATPDAVLLATGSELQVAIGAAQTLANEGKKIRVISVPSMERLLSALALGTNGPAAGLLPAGVPVHAIEAGSYMSWGKLVAAENFAGIDGFGECGPGEKVAAHFGLTIEGLVARFKR